MRFRCAGLYPGKHPVPLSTFSAAMPGFSLNCTMTCMLSWLSMCESIFGCTFASACAVCAIAIVANNENIIIYNTRFMMQPPCPHFCGSFWVSTHTIYYFVTVCG